MWGIDWIGVHGVVSVGVFLYVADCPRAFFEEIAPFIRADCISFNYRSHHVCILDLEINR